MLLNASASMKEDVDYLVSMGDKKHRLRISRVTKSDIVIMSGRIVRSMLPKLGYELIKLYN